jgi:ATP-GRASP peptide maturase of grasp-with-spasm system
MILILSQGDEKSTDDVLVWLKYFGLKFFRINETDIVEDVYFELGNNVRLRIKINSVWLELTEVTSYWYRRGKFNFKFNTAFDDKLKTVDFILYRQYFDREFEKVVDFLHEYLLGIRHINSYFDNQLSKVSQIFFARQSGLQVPETLITNSKQDLIKFFTDKENVIIKAVDSNTFKKAEKAKTQHYLVDHVAFVDLSKVALDPNHFFLPTKFQAYQQKKFEIRVFYLAGALFAMAIFSQQNEKTKVDFRNYDFAKPNRVVPFLLPAILIDKIKKFMHSCSLTSGSLDFVYKHNGQFVFLEVNPIGQFDWLSKSCNYNIPFEIAKYLSNNEANNK